MVIRIPRPFNVAAIEMGDGDLSLRNGGGGY